MDGSLPCQKLSRDWHEQFNFQNLEKWRFPPNKSDSPIDSLAYNVMASMVMRLRQNTNVSSKEALLALRVFPELHRDPDWLSQRPRNMTILQWGIHRRHQDPELDAWLRGGSPIAILFSNDCGKTPGLTELVLQKRLYRQIGNIVTRAFPMTDEAALPTAGDWVEQLRLRNLAVAALNAENKIGHLSFNPLFQAQVNKPLNTREILGEVMAATVIPSPSSSAQTPANAPIEVDGHQITSADGGLICLDEPYHQCGEMLRHADWHRRHYPVIRERLELRLQKRLNAPVPMRLFTPKFDWSFLDLAPSFAGRPVYPGSVGEYIVHGVNGATAEFWISQGLVDAAQIKLANLISESLYCQSADRGVSVGLIP